MLLPESISKKVFSRQRVITSLILALNQSPSCHRGADFLGDAFRLDRSGDGYFCSRRPLFPKPVAGFWLVQGGKLFDSQ